MKKIITLRELDEWFYDIFQIIQDICISYKNIEYITNLKNQKIYQFLQEDFFIFYKYQQRFIIVIQLCKLLIYKPETHKRNILSLCDKLIENEYDKNILKLLNDEKRWPRFGSKEKVIEKIKEIKSKIKENQKIIDKINIVRDKIYAHTDKLESEVIMPNLKEIKSLVHLILFFYNNIYGSFYGKNTDFTKGVINLTIKDVVRIFNKGLPQKKNK